LSYCSTVNREQERYSKERGRDDMTMTGKKMATVWMAVAMAIAFLLISGAKTVYAITQIDSGPINSPAYGTIGRRVTERMCSPS